MGLQVREISFQDLFSVSKILKKINIKQVIKEQNIIDITKKDETEKSKITDRQGLEFFIEIILNAGDADKEIMKFIADLSDVKVEEVQKWKLSELKEFYNKFMEVNKLGDVISFFKSAMDSMK